MKEDSIPLALITHDDNSQPVLSGCSVQSAALRVFKNVLII